MKHSVKTQQLHYRLEYKEEMEVGSEAIHTHFFPHEIVSDTPSTAITVESETSHDPITNPVDFIVCIDMASTPPALPPCLSSNVAIDTGTSSASTLSHHSSIFLFWYIFHDAFTDLFS